jgi:Mrp family chromosome partitioning ATPase/capsular polysaccharide biosynthesis protein
MNETTDATAIFAPLWKRKWLILAVGILVGAGAYAYYKRAQHVYSAMTQVYLGAGAEEQAPGEKPTKLSSGNQAAIINSIVIETVRRRLRQEGKGALAHGSKVRAKAAEKSQFIAITVEAHTARGAVLLANATAQAYIRRAQASHERGIKTAIAISRRQLHRIEAASAAKAAQAAEKSATAEAVAKRKAGSSGAPASSSTSSSSTSAAGNTANVLQAATLSGKINQLEAQLSAGGAQQVNVASVDNTQLLAPKPRKNAIFGFVIGIVLASIAAYLLTRFDRRLRSLANIETVLQTQILTALPKVNRPIVQREGEPSPSKYLLEPLRRLHNAFLLGNMFKHAEGTRGRAIVVISPDPGDGKSTLVAALALVQRDAGQRVAVVDANLRRPLQAKLLGMDGSRGLADVLEGTLAFDEAVQRVRPATPPAGTVTGASATGSGTSVATVLESRTGGSLDLLASGGTVANPPALLASAVMSDLLHSLTAEFDFVLIDTPSPLEVTDAMPLVPLVDGIAIVARVGHTREASAQRLVQLLANASSAPVLGTVANSVARTDVERYGFSATPGRRGWLGKLLGR